MYRCVLPVAGLRQIVPGVSSFFKQSRDFSAIFFFSFFNRAMKLILIKQRVNWVSCENFNRAGCEKFNFTGMGNIIFIGRQMLFGLDQN